MNTTPMIPNAMAMLFLRLSLSFGRKMCAMTAAISGPIPIMIADTAAATLSRPKLNRLY